MVVVRIRAGRLLGTVAGLVLAATPWTGAPVAATTPYSLATRVVDGTALTLRWDPCQAAIAYRVNPRSAATTTAGSQHRRAPTSRTAFARLRAGHRHDVPLPRHDDPGAHAAPPGATASATRRSSSRGSTRGPARTTLLGRSRTAYAAGTGGYSYKTWTWPLDAAAEGGHRTRLRVLNAADNHAFAPGFGSGTDARPARCCTSSGTSSACGTSPSRRS